MSEQSNNKNDIDIKTAGTETPTGEVMQAQKKKMSKQKKLELARRKRKKMIQILVWIIIIVIVVGLVVDHFVSASSNSGSTTTYTTATVSTGDLSQSVSGTGTLSFTDNSTVTLPNGLTVATTNAAAGDTVTKGQILATLDKASIASALSDISSQVSSAAKTLATLSTQTATTSIYSPVAGVVKQIYGKDNADVATVMSKYHALAIVSSDGNMIATIKVSNTSGLSVGLAVNVTISSGTVQTGTIDSVATDGKSFTVLTSDATAAVGSSVTVKTTGGTTLGTGTLAINEPVTITAVAGTIDATDLTVNESVATDTVLYTLTNVPMSPAYTSEVATYNNLCSQLAQLQAFQKNPVITSPITGIIETYGLTTSTGSTGTTNSGSSGSSGNNSASSSSVVIDAKTTCELTVPVDELDILNMKVGQKATVTFDAISGTSFTGKVSSISSSGNTSNNVTTYPVTITLPVDTRMMPGMNATANIIIAEHDNVLTVPVDAVNTNGTQSFVYIYNGKLPSKNQTNATPGTVQNVTIGLSDANNVEITSGLTAGQTVVIVRTLASAQSSTANNTTKTSNFGGAGGLGGLTGGGTRTYGGGGFGG